MSFLNATLLLGGLAAAVPIVLHLIARQEPRRVVFPAVRFLAEQVEVQRRRLQIRRWVLLAFRALLLALLALALAQPHIETAQSPSWMTISALGLAAVVLFALAAAATVQRDLRGLAVGLLAVAGLLSVVSGSWAAALWLGSEPIAISDRSPAAVAIVIDNSPRSGVVNAEGSRIDRMREVAEWMIGRYPSESRLAIIDRSARPATFSLDGATAGRTLAKLEPLQVTVPLATRIEAAVRLVRSSDLQRRAVFVLTDLSEASWTPPEGTDASVTLPPLLAETPAIDFQVFDVTAGGGEAATRITNRRLGEVTLADRSPARGVPVPLSLDLTLESLGGSPATEAASQQVQCELQLYEASGQYPVIRDGQTVLPPQRTVDRASVQVSPAAPAECFLTLPPLEPGTHQARVVLTGNDALAIDDTRYFTVAVLPPAELLMLSDDAAAAEHLARILNAEFEPGDPRAEFRIDQKPYPALRGEVLEGHDAVALIDPPVPSFTGAQLAALTEYVQAGGNLVVVFGGAAKASGTPSTNPQGAGAELRAALFPLQRIWREPDPGTFLEVLRPAHPVFRELSKLAGGVPWGPFRIRRYWQLNLQPEDAVLARYAGSRNPALVERMLGGGRVVLMTTPIAPSTQHPLASWNRLFSAADAWPAFLLMRQIFDHVADRDAAGLNVRVGEAVAIPIGDRPASLERLQMLSKQSAPVPVPIDGGQAIVGATERAGNYWLRGTPQQIGFAANLPESATRLQKIDPGLLDELLGPEQYALVTDREAIRAAEGRSREARPLVPQAMLLVLALFVGEQVLANRFYRRSAGRPPLRPARVV